RGRQRLLTQHRLAGRGGRNGYLRVRTRWRADVDHIDVRPAPQLTPVVGPLRYVVARGCRLDCRFLATGDDNDSGCGGELRQHGRRTVAVAVGPAHGPVAN